MKRVLIWQGKGDTLQEEGRKLWAEMTRRGWLPSAFRAVIQLEPGANPGLVLATARSLVDFLRQRSPSTSISLLASGGLSEEEKSRCAGGVWLEIGLDENHTLASPCLPDGVRVPALWLQSFCLITISSPGPDRRQRISGPLLAQAMLLRRNNAGRLYASELACEAHRLASSDLGIVCGSNPDDRQVWMVSTDDVALELAVERAAGLQAGTLPMLKCLAQHQIVDVNGAEIEGQIPDWRSLATPTWQFILVSSLYAVARFSADLGRDLRLVEDNWWRVPRFLRKRLRRGVDA